MLHGGVGLHNYAAAILINLREGATVLLLLITVIIYWLIRRDAAISGHRDATMQVYHEWWGDEMNALRKYFFREFLPQHRQRLLGKSIREIESIVENDKGRIRKLCYFFERVGWLGAAGLIDVDYILGPMQHVVRMVWLSMEPFIIEERNVEKIDSVHHTVYLSGFEWLFKRSEQKHQAVLIRTQFRHPRLRTWEEIEELREWIDTDEAKFRKELGIKES